MDGTCGAVIVLLGSHPCLCSSCVSDNKPQLQLRLTSSTTKCDHIFRQHCSFFPWKPHLASRLAFGKDTWHDAKDLFKITTDTEEDELQSAFMAWPSSINSMGVTHLCDTHIGFLSILGFSFFFFFLLLGIAFYFH